MMRALFRPFALHAAYTPIETIVFFCILGTLAYFHILSAIKNSYDRPAAPVLLPAYATLLGDSDEWVGVREAVWNKALDMDHDDFVLVELHQVAVSSPSELLSSAELGEICFRPSPSDSCFLHHSSSSSPTRLTIGLNPNTRDDLLAAFPPLTTTTTTTTSSTSLVALRALTLRFYTLAKKADSIDILLILLGYILMHTTFYLLITRSYALGSTFFLPLAILSSALLALLLALPIAMALDIPIDPVALSEALPFLVCTVGFDKPLRLARAVFHHPHLELPPSQAAPTIPHPSSGYPILANPTSPSQHHLSSTLLKPSPKIITESLSYVYKPIIRDYILEIAVLTVGAYSRVGGLKEVCALAALILAVDCLLICTYLAAIFGVMVEVRRIQTQRQKTKSILLQSSPSTLSSRSSSFTNLSTATATATAPIILKPSLTRKLPVSVSVPPTTPQKKKTEESQSRTFNLDFKLMGRRRRIIIKLEFGWFGWFGKFIKDSGDGTGKRREKENPVARLKLLLIASFLILHILNFITPLTPSKQHSHSHPHSLSTTTSHLSLSHYSSSTHGDGSPAIPRKVDLKSTVIRGALNALVEVLNERDRSRRRRSSSLRREVFVKVLPVVKLRVPSESVMTTTTTTVMRPYSVGRWIGSIFFSGGGGGGRGRLTTRSGKGRQVEPKEQQEEEEEEEEARSQISLLSLTDPVLSKWLLLMLGLSVLLNGYLLRGIAAGFVGGVGEEGGREVRFLEEREDERKSVVEEEEEEEDAAAAMEEKERLCASVAVATQTMMMMTTAAAAASTLKASSLSGTIISPTPTTTVIRPFSTLLPLFNDAARPLAPFLATLNDEELILLVQNGKVAVYDLERVLSSGIELLLGEGEDEDEEMKKVKMKAEALERAVRVRRALISRASKTQTLERSDIPLANYDYSRVLGACCENVVGYIPLPLGIAGPLTVDGESFPIPMATAEGTLVASTSRGCKALNLGGGVTTVVVSDGMTRAPAVEFPNVKEGARAKSWIDSDEGWTCLRGAFESTSRFAKLVGVKAVLAGRTMFVRFKTETGDAMGMNMISKGSEKALERMGIVFPCMKVLAISGNYCTDKKPAAVNWIEGRGKSVVAEAVIPNEVVKKVLKTSVGGLVKLGLKKNLVGSAMAGSVGGFNAHAANILTAVYLATGQDPAQNVESSQCMTLFEAVYPPDGTGPGGGGGGGEPEMDLEPDLLITITMPCIEVGTVGGGTVLGPQQAVLEMLGLKGAHPTHPGKNAQRLARVVAAAVMAGELSLMAALASGELVRAHMRHNRSGVGTPATTTTPMNAMMMTPTPTVPTSGVVVEEKNLLNVPPVPPMLLTPASSTASSESLPPYSK